MSARLFAFALLFTVLGDAIATEGDSWIRLGSRNDQHFLVGTDGEPFLALGVNHIGALSRTVDGSARVRGSAAWQKYWTNTLEPQFEDWNLTTLGYGAPPELRTKAPWFETIGLVPIEKHRSDIMLHSVGPNG